MTYVSSSLVCLVLFIILNWYDKMDLTLGDLVMFAMISFIPIINGIFLLYVLLTMVFRVDLSEISITLLRGRK